MVTLSCRQTVTRSATAATGTWIPCKAAHCCMAEAYNVLQAVDTSPERCFARTWPVHVIDRPLQSMLALLQRQRRPVPFSFSRVGRVSTVDSARYQSAANDRECCLGRGTTDQSDSYGGGKPLSRRLEQEDSAGTTETAGRSPLPALPALRGTPRYQKRSLQSSSRIEFDCRWTGGRFACCKSNAKAPVTFPIKLIEETRSAMAGRANTSHQHAFTSGTGLSWRCIWNGSRMTFPSEVLIVPWLDIAIYAPEQHEQ